MELLLPTKCSKSSSDLEGKCYHFVTHVDAAVHSRDVVFGCICVYVCHQNSSGCCDCTVYLLLLQLSGWIHEHCLVETCTWRLMKSFYNLLRGNPLHDEAQKSNANYAGWLQGRRNFCLLFLCVCFLKKGNYCMPFSDSDTYFPKLEDEELWFLQWLSYCCCSDSVTDLLPSCKMFPFGRVISKQFLHWISSVLRSPFAWQLLCLE